MWVIDRMAEQKISEAIANGDLDDLPGQGQPLCLDDDCLVPPELRMANRILKNAGYLPPQASLRRDIAAVETLIVQAVTEEERTALNKRLNYLLMQLGTVTARSPLLSEAQYREKLKAKTEAQAG